MTNPPVSTEPLVSIVIPHFQTPELAKLCLRSLAHFRGRSPFEVIVVDNNSQDGQALSYLRSVSWIRLIERGAAAAPFVQGHLEACDVGIEAARGKYVLLAHTDTIPVANDWLDYHVRALEQSELIAAVGTDKLVLRPWWQAWLIAAEDALTWWKRYRIQRVNNRTPFIRSHCGLYRRSVLHQHGLRFLQNRGLTAGHSIHLGLTELGYQCKLLDPREVGARVVHLNHATMALLKNPQMRPGAASKQVRRIHQFLNRPEVKAIMNDETLDDAPQARAAA